MVTITVRFHVPHSDRVMKIISQALDALGEPLASKARWADPVHLSWEVDHPFTILTALQTVHTDFLYLDSVLDGGLSETIAEIGAA